MTSGYAHNRFLTDPSENDVTDAGNVNLDSTFTTSQDEFTLNQEMVTKKYVDDTCTRIVQPIIANVNYNTNEIATLVNTTSTNTTNIATNADAITSLQNTTSVHTSNITTNTNAITTLQNLTSTNAASITTNTNAITTLHNTTSTNTANITTNAANITTNTNAITTLQNTTNTNAANITTNTNAITTMQNTTSTNTANITANTNAITTLQNTTSTNTANTTTNTNAITTLQNTTSINTAAITTLQNAPSTSISNVGTATSLLTSTSELKGLDAGTGLSLVSSGTDVTLTNASPASDISLVSTGSGSSLLSASSTNPSFSLKSLIPGSGITLTSTATDITIGSGTFPVSTMAASSVAYIDSSSKLTSSATNMYCQAGIDNLQTLVNTIQPQHGNCIQLSSGTHTISSPLTITSDTITISGIKSPCYSPSSTISGNTVIGMSSKIKLVDISFYGSLTIASGSTQKLEHYITNCEIQGNIYFPDLTYNASYGIYFKDCIISVAGYMTIYNTDKIISFDNCWFDGQFIQLVNSKQLSFASTLIFRNCSGLPSNLGNCVMDGVNTYYTGVSTTTALNSVYPTFISRSFSLTVSSGTGTGGTPTTVTVNYRKISNGTQTMVTLIFPITNITMGSVLTSWASTTAVLPADIRPAIATYFPIAVRNGSTHSMGLLWIYASGNLQISDLGHANAFTVNTVCGINAPQQVTYVI